MRIMSMIGTKQAALRSGLSVVAISSLFAICGHRWCPAISPAYGISSGVFEHVAAYSVGAFFLGLAYHHRLSPIRLVLLLTAYGALLSWVSCGCPADMGSSRTSWPISRGHRRAPVWSDDLYGCVHRRSGPCRHSGGLARSERSGLFIGFAPGPTLRLIVVPQAMRVIIPPLTSQYLDLTENSSLAVAIGYPDLVQVFPPGPCSTRPARRWRSSPSRCWSIW